jgi:hypothetical protein
MTFVAPITALMHGNQPGDPKLGIARMVNVIKRKGMVKGKEIPWRVPIGTDITDIIKTKCEETLKIIDEWKVFSMSTDFPGAKEGFLG